MNIWDVLVWGIYKHEEYTIRTTPSSVETQDVFFPYIITANDRIKYSEIRASPFSYDYIYVFQELSYLLVPMEHGFLLTNGDKCSNVFFLS
jgi:hypothetical protein